MVDDQIGYLRVNFYIASGDSLNKQLSDGIKALESQGMKRIILDLRGNKGGSVNFASSIADKFLHSGVITRLQDKEAV